MRLFFNALSNIRCNVIKSSISFLLLAILSKLSSKNKRLNFKLNSTNFNANEKGDYKLTFHKVFGGPEKGRLVLKMWNERGFKP